jgi:hypothetical protein
VHAGTSEVLSALAGADTDEAQPTIPEWRDLAP